MSAMDKDRLLYELSKTFDEPFDYRERASEELVLDPEGASFPDGPGEVGASSLSSRWPRPSSPC